MSDAALNGDAGEKAENKAVETVPAPSPAPAKGGCGAGTIFFAVVLSALASGALVVGSPYWTPLTEKYVKLPNPLKQVENENLRLGRNVSELDQKVTALIGDTAKLKELVGSSSSAASGLRAATLALAGAQLRARLTAGDAYELELGAVRAAAGDDPDVKALVDSITAFAATGVPTRAAVRDAFPAAVAAVVTAEAENAAGKAAGWYESVGALLGQLGYVIQVSEAPKGSAHQVIRQARAQLAVGDLAGAAEVMSNLPAPPVPEADEWLTAAKARVAADKAESQLLTLSLSRLGSAK